MPDNAGKAGRIELEEKAISLRKLTEINPHNEEYLRSYAEVLIQLQRDIRADHVLGQLHQILIKQDKAAEAEEVESLRQSIISASSSAQFGVFLKRAAEQASILSRPKRLQLAEGDYLFHEHDDGSDVFLLIDGELCAWQHYPDHDQPVLLCNLRPGSIAGDIAYFHDGKRCADLLASQPSTLLKFSSKQFSRLLLEQPDLQDAWQQYAEMRNRMFLLSMNGMLASTPENMRLYLAQHSEIKKLSTFSVLAKEGEPIESVDLVVSGLLRRIVEGHTGDSHIFTSINPGQLCGWEASMHGHTGFSSDTNLTSLIAMDPTTLISIPMAVFQEVLELHPPLRVTVSRNIHQYVSNTLSTLRNIDNIE